MKYPFTVESLTIHEAEDRTVGIFGGTFRVEVYLEIDSKETLEDWRKKFEALYSEFCDTPKCQFDFEERAQAEKEHALEVPEEPEYHDDVDHFLGTPWEIP